MADFKLAMPTVLFHEGKFVNDLLDGGGCTNYGVSLRFLLTTGDLDGDTWQDGDLNHDGKINIEDIRLLTELEAIRIYKNYFWLPNRYDRNHQHLP